MTYRTTANRNLEFHNAINEYITGYFDEAILSFNRALRAPFDGGENSDGLIYNNIATCYTKLQRHHDAIENYLKALDNGLFNEDVLFSLATSYHKTNDELKALEFYDKVVELNPYSGKAYYLRGKCNKRLGEFLKGNADLNESYSMGYIAN